jgi:hypothetical protein
MRTEFELDRFVVDGDRLVVEGRWHGVVGRRFLRPELSLAGRRRLVAVLDHKPSAERARPESARRETASLRADLDGARAAPARLEPARSRSALNDPNWAVRGVALTAAGLVLFVLLRLLLVIF